MGKSNLANISRFGTSSRDDSLEKLKSTIPGPGQYEQKNIIGTDGPAKSISGKTSSEVEIKEHRQKPGPGQYAPNFDYTCKQQPKIKVGTAPRDDIGFKK